LVLYLKDLNIVMPDKWGTCQLTAFLEQVILFVFLLFTDQSKSSSFFLN